MTYLSTSLLCPYNLSARTHKRTHTPVLEDAYSKI